MPRVKSFGLRRGRWINGYQIRERLGRGWEGEVYRVREQYSHGQRVLKLFDPAHYRSRHIEAYCNRLEKLSTAPGVIRFYHAGHWEERDCHYLVMQYIEGTSLEKATSKRAMPLFRALRIVRELLKIVQACHDRGCRVGDIHAVVEDLKAACKLLYSLNWNHGPYAPDLRSALPKHGDAVAARYKSAGSVLDALNTLMGA